MSFPFKRKQFNDKQIHEMMNNLKKYNVKKRLKISPYTLKNVDISKEQLQFLDKPIILLNNPSDYNDFNQLSDMFNEECRMKCRLINIEMSPWDYYFKNIIKIKELTKKQYGKINDYNLRETLWHQIKECTSFRPSNMVAMIQLFKSSSILDFSSGWGDRLLGAIAMNVEYVGVDPNPCLFKGYNDILKFFNQSNNDKYIMIQGKIEDVILPQRNYDLIFTSPPYYDLEIYTHEIKNNEKEWYNNFLLIALNKCWNLLNNGGVMAININQKTKNENYIKWMLNDVSKFNNSYYLGVISYAMEDLKNPQPIWVWKKK